MKLLHHRKLKRTMDIAGIQPLIRPKNVSKISMNGITTRKSLPNDENNNDSVALAPMMKKTTNKAQFAPKMKKKRKKIKIIPMQSQTNSVVHQKTKNKVSFKINIIDPLNYFIDCSMNTSTKDSIVRYNNKYLIHNISNGTVYAYCVKCGSALHLETVSSQCYSQLNKYGHITTEDPHDDEHANTWNVEDADKSNMRYLLRMCL